MLRFSKNKLIFRILICCLVYLIILNVTTRRSYRPIGDSDTDTLSNIELKQYHRSEKLSKIHTYSTNYDNLIRKYGMSAITRHFSLTQRCNAYFNLLMANDSLLIEPNTDLPFFRDDYEGNDPEVWGRVRNIEQRMHDQISHMRLFTKCFLQEDSPIKQQTTTESTGKPASRFLGKAKFKWPSVFRMEHSCKSIESKIYPWLSGAMPTYTRWDGTKKLANSGFDTVQKFFGECFLNLFESKLEGKGIVLTISDDHVDSTIRLFKVFRTLENTLPIEIVYWKDLSDESKNRLIKASRDPFIVDNMEKPAQDLWFVDVAPAVQSDYLNKFEGFGNKILATFFNSFAETMLIDADAVIFKRPEYFFEREKYKKAGTLFFKDRLAVEYRPDHDVVFFEKLCPSLMDTAFFGIPQVTDYSLDRQLFKGLNHYMESGLVLMNRRRHFTQPLIMAQLSFHPPVQFRLYGDKELFWLSFVISGEESYAFNEHFLAAIGFYTPTDERPDSKAGSKEICSNHPAHISDEDNHTLLWINSGFRYCGNADFVNYEEEFNAKDRYRHIQNIKDFETFFKGKLIIKNALIPPYRVLEANNLDDEANMAWINMRQYCAGYTWCAYSKIGGRYEQDGQIFYNNDEGYTIDFTPEETSLYERLGDVWISDEFL